MNPHTLASQIVGTLPPGTQVYLMVLTLPQGGPGEAEGPGNEAAAAEASNPAGGLRDLLRDPVRVVEQIRRERDGAALKYQEWATLLPRVSKRALERALQAGTLEWMEKGHGRDHGARMVTPDAMLAYLRRTSGGNAGAEDGGGER